MEAAGSKSQVGTTGWWIGLVGNSSLGTSAWRLPGWKLQGGNSRSGTAGSKVEVGNSRLGTTGLKFQVGNFRAEAEFNERTQKSNSNRSLASPGWELRVRGASVGSEARGWELQVGNCEVGVPEGGSFK